MLGGEAIGALRISDADPRHRHRGVSHHSLTAFGRVALAGVTLVAPRGLSSELGGQVDEDLAGQPERNPVVWVDTDGLDDAAAAVPGAAGDDGPRAGRGAALLPGGRRRRAVRGAAGAGGGARERRSTRRPGWSPELLGWALPALGARGEGGVQYVGLREGGSPWRIELDTGRAGVLRVLPAAARPRLLTELAALEHAAAHGLPVPRVLAADPDGTVVAGKVAVLTTVVPGTSHIPGGPPSLSRFRALGALAATIAAVPAPEVSAALPERSRSIPDVDFAALRRDAPARPLLVAAEEVVAEQAPPARTPGFVHGDLWQGNTLWDGDGALTGVVDWDSAGVGPGRGGPRLAALRRGDVVRRPGRRGGAGRLRGACWAAPPTTSPTGTSSPRCAPRRRSDWFTDAVRDQGRTDLDQPTLLRRRDAFLRAALDRLATAEGPAASLQSRGQRGPLHRGDQLLDALVDGLERVLAQHGALGLVVELEVHPVDGVVALLLLGLRMNSPRSRARVVCGGTFLASITRGSCAIRSTWPLRSSR